jgi:CheY-like chemotaxis protein
MKSAKTLYLVDDDDDDRMLIREALEQVIDQLTIIEAVDGRSLLNLLSSRDPDLQPAMILLDNNMPRMNGLETLAHIRSNPDTEHIPVLMLSTSSDQYYVKNAYNLGVNAYLKKPVLFDDYTYMAESVNVCFLNSYPLLKNGLVHTKSFQTASILVIEDDADHWELMQFALKHSMPKAKTVRMKDSESTLQFLQTEWHLMKQHPQLILLDLYLPTRQQGLDLLEQVRLFLAESGLATLPIIIFSNSNHQEDIKACYQRQANAYMVKPFHLHESISYFKTLNQFIWDTYLITPDNHGLRPEF